jgi:hypothetical protein
MVDEKGNRISQRAGIWTKRKTDGGNGRDERQEGRKGNAREDRWREWERKEAGGDARGRLRARMGEAQRAVRGIKGKIEGRNGRGPKGGKGNKGED